MASFCFCVNRPENGVNRRAAVLTLDLAEWYNFFAKKKADDQ